MLVTNKKRNSVMMKANMDVIMREEVRDGTTYLVGPTVMIKVGVWNGAFYPGEQLELSTLGWNGRPICIWHPETESGVETTANQPEMIKSNIGAIYNALFDDEKLKAEVWIDKEKLRAVAPEVLTSIENNEMLEVSTGLFVQAREEAGDFKGKPYDKVVVNYMPDHLALLPGKVGACSIADGAGFPRFNSQNLEDKGLSKAWNWLKKQLTANKLSHEQIRDDLSDALQTAHNADWLWIQQVDDEEVIYELEFKDQPDVLLKRKYKVENDSIVLDMEVFEVEKTVLYQIKNSQPEQKEQAMEEKEKLVNALIANEKSAFGEDDRVALMGMDEGVLKKIATNEETPEPKAPAKEEPKEEPKAEPKTEPAPVTNEKIDIEAIKKEATADAIKAVKAELAANQAAPIRDRLKANTQCLLSNDALDTMDETSLRSVEAMLGSTNYGGAGGGQTIVDNGGIDDPEEAFPVK